MFDHARAETAMLSLHNDWRVTVAFTIFLLLGLTRALTTLQSKIALWKANDARKPPIIPYSVPVLGNLISFAFNTERFFSSILYNYGIGIPVRIRVLNRNIYFISGAEHILALFRGSRFLSTAPASVMVLENAFGSPPECRHVMERDDTGISREPVPGSRNIAPHNRLFYLDHKLLQRDLQGVSLVALAEKLFKNLDIELSSLDIGYDNWVEVPDLYEIVRESMFRASTSAICGPHLFRLNPEFTPDFWKFDSRLPGLFKNLPRWMIPGSFEIRDKLIASLSKWHKFAAEHVHVESPEWDDAEWEEYFGARIMRERQAMHDAIDGYTDQAHAASDLGMIWGANANIIPLIGWQLLDVLFRPELLDRVRAQINTCCDNAKHGITPSDMPRLLADPLLQSIYSEELRVRNGIVVQRVPVKENFKIGPWKFPRGQMITTSTWHEQRTRSVWNEGPVDGVLHPVDEFWAERFLVYPNNPHSGPRKPESLNVPLQTAKKADGAPTFVTETVAGSFIPYGGGQFMCPGRFYAKQEAICALSMFLTKFDIELYDKEKLPEVNMEYYPFGILPPDRKVPARIRRRAVDSA